MANNRLFMVHQPTRLVVMLGKRMAVGWRRVVSVEGLDEFFSAVETETDVAGQDDFVVCLEDSQDQPNVMEVGEVEYQNNRISRIKPVKRPDYKAMLSETSGFRDDGKFDGDFVRLRRMANTHIESGRTLMVTPELMLQLIDLAEGK